MVIFHSYVSLPEGIYDDYDVDMTRILRRYLPGPLQAQQRCCNPDGSRVAGCTDWMLDLE